jgi:arylsulfatase A-like enzyme
MRQRPNILIFNPDQWRGDVLGHMGNPAAVTPHLDHAAASDFVSFRSAFCQNPVCTPSRCSFMTGWYPHVRGHRSMFHMLRPDEPCLLRVLKDEGYHVWWGGKNDLVPAQNGFGDYCDVKYKPADPTERSTHQLHHDLASAKSPDFYSMYLGRLSPQSPSSRKHGVYYDGDWANVLGAVEHIRSAPRDRPLCIYLPLGFPHPPYGVEEPYYSRIDRHALPPRVPALEDWSAKPALLKGIFQRQALSHWNEARWSELRATYYGMCARVDAQFGLVMRALREAGLYEGTGIFFFSDHGDFTGDYGLVEKTQNTFEDCLVRVPLLIKPPRTAPAQARISEALVELIDVPATIYDYCGITPGYTHFGQSLHHVISGGADEHRDAVFCEGGRLAGEAHASEGQSGIQDDSDSPYWPRVGLQQKALEHTKATMCRMRRYKYVRRLYEADELYDLARDPAERLNLIDRPELAGVRNELKLRMLEWYQATCDVVPHDADRR